MTIIEATVVLSILFILAGAMSPIVSESVGTARAVKAKNDASMIAMGLINLQKDVGGDAQAFGEVVLSAQNASFPDVLMTAGNPPRTEDLDGEVDELPAMTPLALLHSPGQGRGNGTNDERAARQAQRGKWREVRAGSLGDHLYTNRHGYRLRRPGEYAGWNGPYVSAEVKGDPWGNQYMVNTHFLNGASTAADGQGRMRRAVFVVSAGYNGVVETPYEQPINDARSYGDDIVIRIQ